MTNYKKRLEMFKNKLKSMPQNELINALCEYAQTDEDFFCNFETLAETKTSSAEALKSVKKRIDQVFGEEDLQGSMDFQAESRFTIISLLIESILSSKEYDAVIEAAEYSYRYAENLIQVHDPDDFLDRCFSRIIDCWLKSRIAKGESIKQIEADISKRQDDDEYGLAYIMEQQLKEILPSSARK